jgi:hypothetical protein
MNMNQFHAKKRHFKAMSSSEWHLKTSNGGSPHFLDTLLRKSRKYHQHLIYCSEVFLHPLQSHGLLVLMIFRHQKKNLVYW